MNDSSDSVEWSARWISARSSESGGLGSTVRAGSGKDRGSSSSSVEVEVEVDADADAKAEGG